MPTCSFTWKSWRMYHKIFGTKCLCLLSYLLPRRSYSYQEYRKSWWCLPGFLLCNVPSLAGTRLLMLENFSHTNKVCWFCQTDGVGVKHERSHKARLAEFRKTKYEQKDETRVLVSLLWKAYSEIKLVSSQIWRYIIFLSQQVPRGLFLSSHQIFGESDTVPVFKNISKCWICTQRVFSISIPNSPPVIQIFCWFRNWANWLLI